MSIFYKFTCFWGGHARSTLTGGRARAVHLVSASEMKIRCETNSRTEYDRKTVRQIITKDTRMRKISAKMVP
jgi:hypothetical protein